MEHEEVFFVTFVLSLVSIIVLRKGKGDMRGREWIQIAMDGQRREMTWKASSL